MAFLVRQPGRPFWLLRYRDLANGRWVQRSLKLRVDSRPETRRARDVLDQCNARERAARPLSELERWDRWAPAYLALRYGGPEAARTLERYRAAWRSVAAFLALKQAPYPRQLTHQLVREFIDWRQQPTDGTLRPASFNTALAEVKFLGLLLDEAIRLGFADANPCRRLGLKKRPPAPRPAFTEEELRRVEAALAGQPEWMMNSFALARYHGCRLRACQVSLETDVDWENFFVTFHEKGHKTFTVPLAPPLIPLFLRLRQAGARYVAELPPNASRDWCRFLAKLGLGHLSFHSLRVTVISALARGGTPLSVAMAYVGHADERVHRLYQRLRPADLLNPASGFKPPGEDDSGAEPPMLPLSLHQKRARQALNSELG